MRRSAFTENGELTRQGRMLMVRSVVLAALLIAFGFAVNQPLLALTFAVAALAIPGIGMLYLRRQARLRSEEHR